MEVLPSLDIEGGRVVKRVKGLRGTGLVIGDPVEVAGGLVRSGARWVHVVDLDGAELGRPLNLGVVRALKDLGLRVQYGGGLRSLGDVEAASSAGADRIVLGSAWASDPAFLEEASREVDVPLLAAVDEREGRVVHSGWRASSDMTVEDAIRVLEGLPVAGYLYTQVDVEGTMRGPDLSRVAALRSRTRRFLACAGGISSIADLVGLCRAGADAAVIGMALYSGAVRLEEAIEAVRRCARCRPGG
ncbi:MAG: HisA/HisF-related TIM barrel protein [Conexivisphaera sp.]